MKKTIEQVLALAPTEVSMVYTGIDRICRCGCGGEYYATTMHKGARASIDDKQVARLLNRAKKLIREGVSYDLYEFGINVPTHDKSKRGKAIMLYWDELKGIAINFSYNGQDYSFRVCPEESDWWTNEGQFSIHVSEEYNEVCVYLGNDYSVTIHKQVIK